MNFRFTPFILAICLCGIVSTSAKDKSRLATLQPNPDFPKQSLSELGRRSLSIIPEKWQHAETGNFILHYRQPDDAQKVASLAEYVLWFVEKNLATNTDKHTHKSHIFVFENDVDWKAFLSSVPRAPQWAASFVEGHDLFLNVHHSMGSPGKGEPAETNFARLNSTEEILAALSERSNSDFDSKIVAHETTHAVIARLYPAKHWPIWLNEGMAEYMLDVSLAARRNRPVPDHRKYMLQAQIPVQDLVEMRSYPMDHQQVHQFFASSEKLVRFFMYQLPRERFPRFVDAILQGASFEAALASVYEDKVHGMGAFLEAYEAFDR